MISLEQQLARIDTQLDNVNIAMTLYNACKDMPVERRNYIVGAFSGPGDASLIDKAIALVKHLIEMAKEFIEAGKKSFFSLTAKAKNLAEKVKGTKGTPEQSEMDHAGGGESTTLDEIAEADTKDIEEQQKILKAQSSKLEDIISNLDPEDPTEWEEKSKDVESGSKVDVKDLGKQVKKMKDGSVVYHKPCLGGFVKVTTVRDGKAISVKGEKVGVTVKMPNAEELDNVVDKLESTVERFSSIADNEMDKNIERVNKRINDYLTKLQKRVRKGGLTESQQIAANKIVNELTQALKYVNREGRVLDKASYAHAKMLLDMVDKARSNLK